MRGAFAIRRYIKRTVGMLGYVTTQILFNALALHLISPPVHATTLSVSQFPGETV
jgi:hypothetical protein